MTQLLTAVCDHCGATLKLKNPELVGKKVKCPKCEEAFVVKDSSSPVTKKPAAKPAKRKPATEDDDSGFMDVDEDDYDAPEADDEYEDEPRPSRSTRSSRGGKKKSKKSSKRGGNGAQAIKIAAIVLVLIVVMVGAGYGLVQLSKMASSSNVDWLPTDI